MEISEMINEMQTTYRRNKMFTPEEVDTLLDILVKYGHIVECKSISGTSMQQKNKTWETICNEFNKVHSNRRRSVREVRTKYKNLKNQFVRRADGREQSDSISKILDAKIRKIKVAGARDENSSNLTNLFTALLEYPDDVDTKSFVLNEPLENFSQEANDDISMNDSSTTSEDVGTFKKIDLSVMNDPLKHPLTVDESTNLKVNAQQRSAIIDLIRSKHEFAAKKAKYEIEILTTEHEQKLEQAKIEHTRRLEIMNKEHELVVQKLKLEIELLKKN